MNMRNIFLILLLLSCPPARAQTPPANPLVQLMMSQPPVDVSSPVTATATFDPPLVRPGEKSIYRISFNAPEASIRWSEEIALPPQLQLQRTASGQIMQPVGGMMRTLTTFNHAARASEPGRFTVPERVVEVYGKPVVIPAAQLEVQAQPAVPPEPARQLVVETMATHFYVGETFSVRVLLPGTAANTIEGLSQVQLNGDGFVADKNAVRQSIQSLERNGRRTGTFLYETTVTPIAAGSLKLSAQGFTSGMQFGGGPVVITGQVTIPGGPPQYVLLDAEAVSIQVRPLPPGELPGFTGAVGGYTCPPPRLATNIVRVGDPVQLFVTIRGRQNLNHLTPPRPPSVKGWQIFPAVRTGLVGEAGTPEQGAVFSYTLIPTTTESETTPAIPFSCFDPGRGVYVDLTIPPVPVNLVSNDMVLTAEGPGLADEGAFVPEQKLSLSQFASAPGRAGGITPPQARAWFPLVPLLPVVGFGALAIWERRRRYLELHPEIVRRRRARRELRAVKHLLRQAAARGDAPGFTRAAIQALQVACAPHYPAEPRALVGGDVLEILSGSERTGPAGEIVRRVFAAGDATAFATTAPGDDGLLQRQTDLDDVLLKLEARL